MTKTPSLAPFKSEILYFIEFRNQMDAINYSPWKGPFIIAKVTGPGSYELIIEDGVPVRNSWHISQLRRFYA
jgi:hypothetical protein